MFPLLTLPDDTNLQRLLPELIAEYQPRAVWLFGSRAEGVARPDSDYDLLVVLDDVREAETDDIVRAWRVGARCDVNADIVPCTASAFLAEKDVVDTLPYAAWHRGHLLHGH